MGTAVQFGAGNIGRGFLAQLFHESGYEVVFVDVVPEVIAAINDQHRYTIRIVGPGACNVPISNVRAVDGRDADAVAAEVASCDIACTAVGAGALRFVAPNLARGLAARRSAGGPPLNTLVCENLHEAGAHLRSLVAASLPDDTRDAVLAEAGFVQAVVSRMVPIQTPDPDESLTVRVEGYKRLPVDGPAIIGSLPQIVGVEPVSRFDAYEARKLFTHNCGHAALGYLGWQAHIELGCDALSDPQVRPLLDAVLAETGEGLVRGFGFEATEHAEHTADLLQRFANRELGDTCFRLARDPRRKLAPSDRLVGAARLCERTGVAPTALARLIGAALRFDAPDDPSAVAMQTRFAEVGLETGMAEVTGIAADEPLGIAVLQALREASR